MTSQTDSQMPPRRRAVGMIAVALLVTAVVLAYSPTLKSLANKWLSDSETYGHGLLIAAVCVWLLAQRIYEFKTFSGGGSAVLAVFALLALGSVWFVASLGNVFAVETLLFPLVLLAGINLAFGARIARATAFPVLYLVFALSVWELFTKPLQLVTVRVVEYAIGIIGIPAYIFGNFVQVPSGLFEVAAGCAGLNFFVIAIAVGTLFAYLNLRLPVHRVLMVVAAMLIAVLLNWVRVTSLVLIGHATKMQHYLIAVDHYFYGWILFGLALVPLLFVGHLLQNRELKAGVSADTAGAVSAAQPPSCTRLLAAVGLTALFPLLVMYFEGYAPASGSVALKLPEQIGDWQRGRRQYEYWQPDYAGVSDEAYGTYVHETRHVDVYVNRYFRQAQGRELIGSDNHLVDLSGSTRRLGSMLIPTAAGTMRLTEYVRGRRSAELRFLVLHWYQIGARAEARESRAKLWETVHRIVDRRAVGVVALRVSCEAGCEDEREAVSEFADLAGAEFRALILAET